MSDTITKIFEIAHELAAQNMKHSDFLIFLSAEKETYQQYAALLACLETAEKALEEARKVIAPFAAEPIMKEYDDDLLKDTQIACAHFRRAAEWMDKWGKK